MKTRLSLDKKDLEKRFPGLTYDDSQDIISEGFEDQYSRSWEDDGSLMFINVTLTEMLEKIQRQEKECVIGSPIFFDKMVPGYTTGDNPSWQRVEHSKRKIIIPIKKNHDKEE